MKNLLLLLFVSCLLTMACNPESKTEASKQQTKSEPNILPIDANAKSKTEIDLKQRSDQTEKKVSKKIPSKTANQEPFKWNETTEQEFIQKCETSTSKNPKIDIAAYCPCVLELLKNGYGPNDLNTAVQENPQKAANCLRVSIKQDK